MPLPSAALWPQPSLPPLSTVAAAWIDLLKDGELVSNGAASLWRAGAGLSLAILIGAGIYVVQRRVARTGEQAAAAPRHPPCMEYAAYRCRR